MFSVCSRLIARDSREGVLVVFVSSLPVYSLYFKKKWWCCCLELAVGAFVGSLLEWGAICFVTAPCPWARPKYPWKTPCLPGSFHPFSPPPFLSFTVYMSSCVPLTWFSAICQVPRVEASFLLSWFLTLASALAMALQSSGLGSRRMAAHLCLCYLAFHLHGPEGSFQPSYTSGVWGRV